MILSPEQDRALNEMRRWQKVSNEPGFILAGYAGTGKTTLLQHFINGQGGKILCCAPTGKAASVLRTKLQSAQVSTVHRLLYQPVVASTGELDALEAYLVNDPNNAALIQAIEEEKKRLADKDLIFSKKQTEIVPGQVIVVDEASMVTKRMNRDLLDSGARVIYVGDPGQLPPVNDEGFFQKNRPNAMLEQVQRQALDSPIIRLSMRIRNGETIAPFDTQGDEQTGMCRKMPKSSLKSEDWLTYDQVITGTNEARRKVNRYFRRQLGRSGYWPLKGEKVICLKNEMDARSLIGGGNPPFVNGVQGVMATDMKYNGEYGEFQGTVFFEGALCPASFYRYPFQIHYDEKAVDEPWQSRQGLSEFDYAYAITVHKSQGSEWDRLLLADDQMQVNNKEFRKRWLYTAVTRAKRELTWLF